MNSSMFPLLSHGDFRQKTGISFETEFFIMWLPSQASKLLGSQEWPWTSNPSASASWLLHVCTTKSSLHCAKKWTQGFGHAATWALYQLTYITTLKFEFPLTFLHPPPKLCYLHFTILFFAMIGIELMALNVLGKHSTAEPVFTACTILSSKAMQK